jgi:putative endonuclease
MICYILWSPALKSYYIGSTTTSIAERLSMHNNAYYGKNSYSSKTGDWEVFHMINCENKGQMLKIEKHIKSMKSKVYIENLKKYPEISLKLLEKYSDV